MIDIHTHILPGMDDGAADLATTTAMLDMALADGITDIVATPHASLQFSFDAVRRDLNLQLAREARPNGPILYPGCEMHLTPENIELLIRTPGAFTINRHHCVLLELPDPVLAMSVECAVQNLLGHGVRPIIAHPERNRGLQRDTKLVARLVQLGCYLQLTAQSITGSFGAEAQSSARSLLTENMVHFIASDGHGIEHRRPLLAAAFSEIEHQYGSTKAQLLFEENPRALLNGRRVHTRSPAADILLFSLPEVS
jgi:protein-tyrosine phosphatase